MINRLIKPTLLAKFGKGKAIILIGPRQVGKTTLINDILKDKSYLFLDGDDPTVRTLLQNANTEQLKSQLPNPRYKKTDRSPLVCFGGGTVLRIGGF